MRNGRRMSGVLGSVVLVLMVLSQPIHALQITTETQKLVPWDNLESRSFGAAVSVDGDVAVVGDSEAKAAYVFVRQDDGTWAGTQKLTSPVDDFWGFGYSVSISGESIVVGSRFGTGKVPNTGSADVFGRQSDGSWSHVQKLEANDGEYEDQFGFSVSISGDVILVGAIVHGDMGKNAGAVYTYFRQTDYSWAAGQKFIAADGKADDLLGWSIKVHNRKAILGGLRGYGGDCPVGPGDAGVAYQLTFNENNEWGNIQQHTPQDGVSGDAFGRSVSIYGSTAVVGGYQNSDIGVCAGSIDIFALQEDGSWNRIQHITSSDGSEGDNFGFAVDLSQNAVVVGARSDILPSGARGSAYLVTKQSDGSWAQTLKLVASETDARDFGRIIAISGSIVMVGAPSTGGVYLYDLNQLDPVTDISRNSINPSLLGNTPNPFNPSTTIRYSVAIEQNISLTIYNISGQVLRTLIRGRVAAGVHKIVWNGTDDAGRAVASGVYITRLVADGTVETRRMVLVR